MVPTDGSTSALDVAPRSRTKYDLVIGFGTVILAALAVADLGFGARGLIAALLLAVLAVLSVIDLERRILPDRIVLPAAAVILALQLVFFTDQWLEWIVASVGGAAFLLLLVAVYRAGLGMGDVKLMLLLGAGLGKSAVLAFFLGSLAAAAFGIVLLVRHGSSARKMAIPFGPFLACGAAVAVFVSDSTLF